MEVVLGGYRPHGLRAAKQSRGRVRLALAARLMSPSVPGGRGGSPLDSEQAPGGASGQFHQHGQGRGLAEETEAGGKRLRRTVRDPQSGLRSPYPQA